MNVNINNKFFFDNPLKKNSAAEIMAGQIVMGLDDDFNRSFSESVLSNVPEERLRLAEEEKNEVEAADSAEEIISLIRRHKEILSRPYIYKKALGLAGEVMPEITDMYIRNSTDKFLETSAVLLYHSDPKYFEEVLVRYDEIRSPYAKSLICLIVGLRYNDAFDNFLYEEYKNMSFFFPDRQYEQFPLLALYMIHGKYE